MSKKQPIQIQKKRVEYDKIVYSLNKEENTAVVIDCKPFLHEIIIPRSITYESKEYEVINILENAFRYLNVKLVQFTPDSKLQTIGKNAFYYSKIESITIPSSVTLIGEGAFSYCEHLQQIEFASDSKLQIIEKNAFCSSSIVSITIPSSVTLIGENAFSYCEELKLIEIPNDSKLQIIDKNAFNHSAIESFSIPSELNELNEKWCLETPKLMKIKVSPKNQRFCCFDESLIIEKTNIDQTDYDCIVFCVRNIQNVKIPNFIKYIESCSFDYCERLERVEFANDSKLQTIGKYAFSYSIIQSIKIPSSVKLIEESAFYFCYQLQRIDIPNDSKLQTIGDYAFSYSKINSMIIPSSVTLIGENVFSSCNQLYIIEINNNEIMSMYHTAFKNCKNILLMISNSFFEK